MSSPTRAGASTLMRARRRRGPDEATYNWSFADTDEPLDVVPGDEPCKFVAYFPNEGSYNIKLFVVTPAESSTRTDIVRGQDWLIVSMGDSLGAGEGSPNKDAVRGGEPLWQDRRCHRSSQAGSAKAAQMLEQLDTRTSVTFVHTSCSGARTMEGLLEPYAGVDRLLGEKYPEVTLATNEARMIPPQVHTASQLVGSREIDAVYLSIGANDIHFGDLVQVCAVAEPCDALDFATSGLVLETLVCGLLAVVPIVGISCAAFALTINAALVAGLGPDWSFDTAAEVFDRGLQRGRVVPGGLRGLRPRAVVRLHRRRVHPNSFVGCLPDSERGRARTAGHRRQPCGDRAGTQTPSRNRTSTSTTRTRSSAVASRTR